jgi:hypothetical protein
MGSSPRLRPLDLPITCHPGTQTLNSFLGDQPENLKLRTEQDDVTTTVDSPGVPPTGVIELSSGKNPENPVVVKSDQLFLTVVLVLISLAVILWILYVIRPFLSRGSFRSRFSGSTTGRKKVGSIKTQ